MCSEEETEIIGHMEIDEDFDLERQDTDQGRLDVDFFVFDFLSPENAQEVLETKGLAGDRVA